MWSTRSIPLIYGLLNPQSMIAGWKPVATLQRFSRSMYFRKNYQADNDRIVQQVTERFGGDMVWDRLAERTRKNGFINCKYVSSLFVLFGQTFHPPFEA